MRSIIGAIAGAVICFFSLKQCEQPQDVKVVTKVKKSTEYVTKTKTVNIPVTTIKYRYVKGDTIERVEFLQSNSV